MDSIVQISNKKSKSFDLFKFVEVPEKCAYLESVHFKTRHFMYRTCSGQRNAPCGLSKILQILVTKICTICENNTNLLWKKIYRYDHCLNLHRDISLCLRHSPLLT